MECLGVATGLLLSTIAIIASVQTSQPIPVEAAQTYFSEAQSLCQADHGQLWGRSLCRMTNVEQRGGVRRKKHLERELRAE